MEVIGLEEAYGTVVHGDEEGMQWGQLRVGQVPINGVLVHLAKVLVHEKMFVW